MNALPDGWVPRPLTKFDDVIGPFFFLANGPRTQCGLLADERHGNRRGVVHGGVVTSAFDVALGTACRDLSEHDMHATVQLNVHFVNAMKIGEFAVVRAELVRATRSLVFMRGIMSVGERVIAAGDGVWKILRTSQ